MEKNEKRHPPLGAKFELPVITTTPLYWKGVNDHSAMFFVFCRCLNFVFTLTLLRSGFI